MAESFVVYIDEAGDTGFKFAEEPGAGSSNWLCISAVVVRKENDLAIVAAGKAARAKLGWRKDKAFHLRDMKHDHRLVLLDHLVSATCPIRTVTVVCHKPSILEPRGFQEKDRLYFYMVRLLLERVSWLCRDKRGDTKGDGTARLVFAHRRRMSYRDLREYLRHLDFDRDVRIDWTVISETAVEARGSHAVIGLQAADTVASSMFKGLELSGYGHTEPRYATELEPIAYKHSNGRVRGYGLKLWPANAELVLAQSRHTDWLTRLYK